MALSADEVLEEVGSFGWFQIRLLILFNVLTGLLFGWAVMVTGIITAEPSWKCAHNSSVCVFDKAISLGDDNYNHRCNISRSEWNFVDDFTTVVTEVRPRTMVVFYLIWSTHWAQYCKMERNFPLQPCQLSAACHFPLPLSHASLHVQCRKQPVCSSTTVNLAQSKGIIPPGLTFFQSNVYAGGGPHSYFLRLEERDLYNGTNTPFPHTPPREMTCEECNCRDKENCPQNHRDEEKPLPPFPSLPSSR